MRAQNRTEMKKYERDRLGPMPDDRPDNNEAIRMCVNAWHELDGDRPLGYGAQGRIPFTALLAWAEANECDRQTFELLRHVIRQLDNDRIAKENSERKLKGKKR